MLVKGATELHGVSLLATQWHFQHISHVQIKISKIPITGPLRGERRHLHYSEISACVLLGLIPKSSVAFFVCVPDSGQAGIRIFNCLSIDKEEITLLFPKWWVTSAQTGQAQNTLKGFIPKIKSVSYVFISEVVKVSLGNPSVIDGFPSQMSSSSGIFSCDDVTCSWHCWISKSMSGVVRKVNTRDAIFRHPPQSNFTEYLS